MKRSLLSPGFTLIEVVVALAILSLSLAGLLQLSINANRRIAGAVEKWESEHMLAQAAEYLMLRNEDSATVPEEFFPYPGYSVEVECGEAEGLPEDYADQEGQLPLKRWRIAIVRDLDGKVAASVDIDRMGYDDETE